MAQRRSFREPSFSPSVVRNLLIAALPVPDRLRVTALLSIRSLRCDAVLLKPGEPIERVYFLLDGFCSLVSVLESGRMVEVATIGREGMVGLAAMSEQSRWRTLTMVQGESENCYAMPADAFREELDRRGAFYRVMVSYAQAFAGCVMQSTACNAVHSIERRMARWLLHAQDRMERDEFPITQEFVAMMLGASRPMVSILAGTLQNAGLISYHRGRMKITQRKGLELVACECYGATRELLANVTSRAYEHVEVPSVRAARASKPQPVLGYRCIACGGSLAPTGRGTTRSRSGRVVTESYECMTCDAGYVLTPSTGWWRPVDASD